MAKQFGIVFGCLMAGELLAMIPYSTLGLIINGILTAFFAGPIVEFLL